MNLDGKRILIAGVETEANIAVSVAALARELGADILLASFGRTRPVAECADRRLPEPCEVLELDPGKREGRDSFQAELASRWRGLEGAVHVGAYAPSSARDDDVLGTEMESAQSAFLANAYSLSALARAVLPVMQRSSEPGGSVVGVTLGSSTTCPAGDWFGGTAALEAVNRYLACELGPRGVRVNLVARVPIATRAAEATHSPGWDHKDAPSVAKAVCFLLSDWARAVSGEVLNVDGGAT